MAFNASAAFVLPRHIRVKDGVEARGITTAATPALDGNASTTTGWS